MNPTNATYGPGNQIADIVEVGAFDSFAAGCAASVTVDELSRNSLHNIP